MSLSSNLVSGLEEFNHYIRHQCRTTNSRIYQVLEHTGISLKTASYALLLLTICLWLAIRFISSRSPRRQRNNLTPPSTPNTDKNTPFKPSERSLAEWSSLPTPFVRPPASPYPNWSHTHTKPLPYRPFRHGPKYNITMGLRRMTWDEWIELDNQYLEFHTLKAKRIKERGEKCCKTAPEAYEGAMELLEELCDYLPGRYPSMFRRLHEKSDESPDRKGIENIVTGEVFDISAQPLAEDPMIIAGRMIQDDIALMLPKPDGQYHLLAGSILLAGFWRLSDKFGMCLSDIHTSGDVPGFKEKLERGMLSFFKRLKPDAPMLRNNYFIQVDDKLAWSESIGNEDEEGIGWFSAAKDKVVEGHWFRSERQSLRRLPRSGAVVFTIRTYFHPITEICQEPYVPGRLASAIRSWGSDVSQYKGRDRYGDVLLEYLDKMHEEQVVNGLDLTKEDEVYEYPY